MKIKSVDLDLESTILSKIRQRQLLYDNCENQKNMWNKKILKNEWNKPEKKKFTGVKNK